MNRYEIDNDDYISYLLHEINKLKNDPDHPQQQQQQRRRRGRRDNDNDDDDMSQYKPASQRFPTKVASSHHHVKTPFLKEKKNKDKKKKNVKKELHGKRNNKNNNNNNSFPSFEKPVYSNHPHAFRSDDTINRNYYDMNNNNDANTVTSGKNSSGLFNRENRSYPYLLNDYYGNYGIQSGDSALRNNIVDFEENYNGENDDDEDDDEDEDEGEQDDQEDAESGYPEDFWDRIKPILAKMYYNGSGPWVKDSFENVLGNTRENPYFIPLYSDLNEDVTNNENEDKKQGLHHKPAPSSPLSDVLQVSSIKTTPHLPFCPPLDVYEHPETYSVVMAISGASASTLEIDFHPSTHELVVKGFVSLPELTEELDGLKLTSDDEDGTVATTKKNTATPKCLINELRTGHFERVVKFPLFPKINEDTIKANYSPNGFLTVKVEKLNEHVDSIPKPKKKITIQNIPDENEILR